MFHPMSFSTRPTTRIQMRNTMISVCLRMTRDRIGTLRIWLKCGIPLVLGLLDIPRKRSRIWRRPGLLLRFITASFMILVHISDHRLLFVHLRGCKHHLRIRISCMGVLSICSNDLQDRILRNGSTN